MHNNTHFYSHSYYTDSNTEGDSDRFVSEDDGSEDGSTAGLDTARSELESARERHDDAGGALNRGLERLQISNPAGKRPNRRRAPTADATIRPAGSRATNAQASAAVKGSLVTLEPSV